MFKIYHAMTLLWFDMIHLSDLIVIIYCYPWFYNNIWWKICFSLKFIVPYNVLYKKNIWSHHIPHGGSKKSGYIVDGINVFVLWKNNINRMALNRRKKHKMEMVTNIALKYIGLCASVSVIIYLGSVKCISTEIKSEQSGLISEHYHISPSLDELRYKGYLKTMYINVIYKTLNFIKS